MHTRLASCGIHPGVKCQTVRTCDDNFDGYSKIFRSSNYESFFLPVLRFRRVHFHIAANSAERSSFLDRRSILFMGRSGCLDGTCRHPLCVGRCRNTSVGQSLTFCKLQRALQDILEWKSLRTNSIMNESNKIYIITF